MLYTELTTKAMAIAYEAHNGQYDKSGAPYFCHPFHIAEQMPDDEYLICVALLHDTVEDTEVTLEDLAKDFPSEVVEAVKLLTHDKKSETYEEYVKKILSNPLAKMVKIADVKHNSDPSRLSKDFLPEETIERLTRKYNLAKEILQIS